MFCWSPGETCFSGSVNGEEQVRKLKVVLDFLKEGRRCEVALISS